MWKTHSKWDTTHSSVIAHHNIPSLFSRIEWKRLYILHNILQKNQIQINFVYGRYVNITRFQKIKILQI